jgi:hypothetical protein
VSPLPGRLGLTPGIAPDCPPVGTEAESDPDALLGWLPERLLAWLGLEEEGELDELLEELLDAEGIEGLGIEEDDGIEGDDGDDCDEEGIEGEGIEGDEGEGDDAEGVEGDGIEGDGTLAELWLWLDDWQAEATKPTSAISAPLRTARPR